MKRIITVTGATGFVGYNITPILKRYYDLDILSCRFLHNQTFKFNSFAVIHLSGKVEDSKKMSNQKDYYEANYELTKQLFDAFLLSDAEVFIFLSSVKAVSDEEINILTEITSPNPQTIYGKSKLLAENYILSKELPQHKRVYILRPCMVHGPGNNGNLNLLYQLVSKGIPWPLGAFENLRSFCSIKNLCFVIKEILKNDNIFSGVYNIADDKPISTNQLISLIANSQNKNKKVFKIPKVIILSIAKIGDLLRLPLNTERLHKLTESYVVSNQKIVNAIGKPLPVKTEQGLLHTFKSFKTNTLKL